MFTAWCVKEVASFQNFCTDPISSCKLNSYVVNVRRVIVGGGTIATQYPPQVLAECRKIYTATVINEEMATKETMEINWSLIVGISWNEKHIEAKAAKNEV